MDLETRIEDVEGGFAECQYRASWFACNHGHAEALAELQKAMTTSEQIKYALTVAVEHKRTELVQQLLEHPLAQLTIDDPKSSDEELGRDIFTNSHTFRNSLSVFLNLACSGRDLRAIELLLAAGADANEFALHDLARSKAQDDAEISIQCFKLLINAGADLEKQEDNRGSPLHQAADVIAATMLLQAGADVEAENRYGETPVHTCENVEILKVLVEIGKANLEKTNTRGQTPLLAAMSSSFTSLKNPPVILVLVDLGANVDAIDKEGNGVFHYAIKKYYSGFPEGLIERFCVAGADINRPNQHGEAPIHLTKIDISRSFTLLGTAFPKKTTRFETLVAAGARLASATAGVNRNPLFKWISDSLCSASNADLADIMATLVQCGASLDVVDDQGRSLLHDAVRSSRHEAQIQFLLDQGLNPWAVDDQGNTLWHEAASKLAGSLYHLFERPAQPFNQLTQIGIDPTKPNNLGRTPLHVLSSLWPRSIHDYKRSSGYGIGSGHLDETTAFDVVLSLYSEVDITDQDGVTPLHLASTFCEYLVGRLLQRGANPSRVTKEGCNALHLAARARMPNIVGMLLTALQSDSDSALKAAVSAADHLGRAPLYYACLVGSYESASLLREAGSPVGIDHYASSPWKAITTSEMSFERSTGHPYDPVVGTVLIAHESNFLDQGAQHHRQDRIDELITLLITGTPNEGPMIDKAIVDAASLEADVTVECLLRARGKAQMGESPITDPLISASMKRRQAKREDLEKPCNNCKTMHCKSYLRRALIMNDLHSLPNTLLVEGRLEALPNSQDGMGLLQNLVNNGQASVLQQIVAVGGPQALDDRSGEEPSIVQTRGGSRKEEPLLLRACRRDVSNMDVIAVLVEQAGHNVNTRKNIPDQPEDSSYSSLDIGRDFEGETPLHALVRGEHWWHVNEGLRYFLESGADTELRDIQGMTPLSAVLNRCGWLVFNKRAVELLVRHGADVNAVDRAGHSCLAKACSDVEMTKLLLSHGAIVTQGVLAQAIWLKDVGLLSLLLSHVEDSNIYTEIKRLGRTGVAPEDRYPLHYAIVQKGSWQQEAASDQEIFRTMIRALLDHGAHPYASYGDTTVLHELVSEGEDLTPLFTSPGVTFDLDVRNALGQTPLHLACRLQQSADKTRKHDSEGRSTVEFLISHGADVRAQDHHGNNIWHVFSDAGAYGHATTDLQRILERAPDLINAANKEGVTPLHNALDTVYRDHILDFLLDNGGDVHALDAKGNSLLHALLRMEWEVSKEGEACGQLRIYFDRLVACGLDVNLRNSAGETPIFNFFRHGAVGSSYLGTADSAALLDQPVYDVFNEAGVDWRVISAAGQNLLHVVAGAAREEDPFRSRGGSHCEKFNALVEMGLDAGLEDGTGRTPLDIAADLGHEEILDMFRES